MKALRGSDCARAARFAASFPEMSGGPFLGVLPMNRKQLEHLIRASGSVSGCDDIVVIGSQAILGSTINAPPELLTSIEADLFPLNAPEKADMIDGCIGELSAFHETFGYYAHGVGQETAILPTQWKSRLVKVKTDNTGGIVGWCISRADLAVSKLLAGRERDISYVRSMLNAKLISVTDINAVLHELSKNNSRIVTKRLVKAFAGSTPG